MNSIVRGLCALVDIIGGYRCRIINEYSLLKERTSSRSFGTRACPGLVPGKRSVRNIDH